MRYDITKTTLAVDTMLPQVQNPRHRAILRNYRLHVLLEISGRYDEILVPAMTVEFPEYCLVTPAGVRRLSGTEQVRAFYECFAEAHSTVMMFENERIAVADWGFASESTIHVYKPGYALEAGTSNAVVDDPEATYIESKTIAMVWSFDAQCRLVGEHVYLQPGANVRKCKPGEAWLVDEVRSVLDPLIAASALHD
jgi:hypothetical protein